MTIVIKVVDLLSRIPWKGFSFLDRHGSFEVRGTNGLPCSAASPVHVHKLGMVLYLLYCSAFHCVVYISFERRA